MNRLLRFDRRVVVITGAGSNLGKAYALLFAERGASVVVNDLGVEGNNSRRADQIVQEIIQKGGNAVRSYDSVTNGENIIKTAIDEFGRIDILINNAGIFCGNSFAKISNTDWDSVNQVHLLGAFKTTRAAWKYFQNQKYGKVINTSSVTGLFGKTGQANYATVKSALLGFSLTLAKEGEKYNTHTNVIVPMAGCRTAENILQADLLVLKPELIAPVVAWLAHEDCPDNGIIVETGLAFAARYQWHRSKGVVFRSKFQNNLSIETVRDKWDQIIDVTDCDAANSPEEVIRKCVETMKIPNNELLHQTTDRESLKSLLYPDVDYRYKVKDTILYSAALGVSLRDQEGHKFLFNNSQDFRVLPTFPVVPTMTCILNVLKTPMLGVNLTKILHSEQYIELYRPLSSFAKITIKTTVIDILDKIYGAMYIMQFKGEDEHGPLFLTESSIFEVGAGKFGGRRETEKTIKRIVIPPKRTPDIVLEFKTDVSQAALYRLCGDDNPLHIDPNAALKLGFPRPILHGLCSYGIAARLILRQYADSIPGLFKTMKGRFDKPVYPGDTLQVETWQEQKRIHFQVTTKETGSIVISGGYVDLLEVKSDFLNIK